MVRRWSGPGHGWLAGVSVDGETIPDAASPFTDEATQGDAAYLWWLVARRYASEGDALRFEILGGPDAKETREILAFNRRCLAAIRRA